MRNPTQIRVFWLCMFAVLSSALALPAAAAVPAAHAARAVVPAAPLAPAHTRRPAAPTTDTPLLTVCPSTIPNCPIGVGAMPAQAAFDPTNQQVYVANEGSNSVSVIDANTDAVVTLSNAINPLFGFSFPFAVAVNPVTNLIYVTNLDTTFGTVTVIDGATNRPLAVVTVGIVPQGIAVDTTTGLVYVANGGGTVSVLTGGANPQVLTITSASFAAPDGVAINSRTHQVFVTNSGGATVSLIDEMSNTVTATIPVGPRPFSIALNASTNVLYVLNAGDSSLSVLHADTFSPIATVALAVPTFTPSSVVVNEQLNHIYVINRASANSVIVLTGAGAPALLATLPAGSDSRFAAVDPGNGRVYVTDFGDAEVQVIQDQQS
jgi:YVTN family beta-propeller protein